MFYNTYDNSKTSGWDASPNSWHDYARRAPVPTLDLPDLDRASAYCRRVPMLLQQWVWRCYRGLAQTNGRSKQVLYSIPAEVDWFGDMVYSARVESYNTPS